VTTYFISGHLDLSDEEFSANYAGRIRAAADEGASFVVGDARGTDAKAQDLLHALGCPRVTVYHLFVSPRNNAGFTTRGGFDSDGSRDAAMTEASDNDIAWVRPGREKSGTARNLARRAKRRAPGGA
jgi:hypothetical protein